MTAKTIEVELPNEAATMHLGEDIALALRPGDVLLLDGDLGAGKTTLARALIRALADNPNLEVPSPTFTIVQEYDARIPLRHFDLYRLAAADELDELGIEELLADSVTIVEWPSRAEGRFPSAAVTIALEMDGAGRRAELAGSGSAFDRIARSLAMRDFLNSAGWGEAQRSRFVIDASARHYETISLPGQPVRVTADSPRLMLGPPVRDGRAYAEIAHLAQTVAAFVGVGRSLKAQGIAVPEVYAADTERGFMLLEHLGDGRFLSEAGEPIASRYAAAAELLATIHGKDWPTAMPVGDGITHLLPPFDRDAMTIEIELLPDWYVPYVSGKPPSAALKFEYGRLWNAALDLIEDGETSILLRDYHSPNLVWRDDRQGHDRLGVLDFQDAMRGPTAYDVASLALDARVDIPPSIEQSTFNAYLAARKAAGDFDEETFRLAYAIMAAQRNSKILGIFVRLDRRDGKPHYLKFLPRIRGYLSRSLAHPALSALRALYDENGFLGAPSS